RDLTPSNNSDVSFQMQFASGITQTFGSGGFFDSGGLSSVGDVNSGLIASVTPGPLGLSFITGDPAQITTPRYNIDLKFAGGQISEADYTTANANISAGVTAGKIKTAI